MRTDAHAVIDSSARPRQATPALTPRPRCATRHRTIPQHNTEVDKNRCDPTVCVSLFVRFCQSMSVSVLVSQDFKCFFLHCKVLKKTNAFFCLKWIYEDVFSCVFQHGNILDLTILRRHAPPSVLLSAKCYRRYTDTQTRPQQRKQTPPESRRHHPKEKEEGSITQQKEPPPTGARSESLHTARTTWSKQKHHSKRYGASFVKPLETRRQHPC